MAKYKADILELRKQGLSYLQIVDRLGCTRGTVAYHCGVGQKLKAQRRAIRGKQTRRRCERVRRQYVSDFIERYKRMCGCKDCGINNPIVLECDHVRGKLYNINQLRNWATDLVIIKEELRKCDVVCANCHRLRTHNRRITCEESGDQKGS